MTSIEADNLIHDLAMELGCKVDPLPITYLGLPIGASKRSADIWDVVRNGTSIRLWLDCWLERRSMREKYPRLYKLSRFKSVTVVDMKAKDWKFDFSRVLNPAESIDLLEIKFDLRNVQLAQEEDEIVGEWTAKGIYTQITNVDADWEFYRVVRSKYVPPKVMFIIWDSMHDSVPTRSMLQERRVVISSNLCLFCNIEVETQDHLFIDCSWVKYFWDFFITSLRVQLARPRDFKSMMMSWKVERVSPRIKLV
ncbi:uncharacterized protein LOC113342547 [Papaver somniferum]|uniref:uncharacterized protein LOC113342547 n=1 Tax=Papaver somniferum TaxID=3469 RepID=UPI000E6F7F89|nr:uncharacterized protein LOC113342547 [Papaver somniferum]